MPIPEQEAFDIEYWLLEEAKLQRMPKPKSLEGRVALVTGGAGGIGGATARRLLAEGACVVITDIDQARARRGAGRARRASTAGTACAAFRCDVTDEASVRASYAYTLRELGGLDILVSNAGIASAAPVEETTLELWNRNLGILATGYFLVSRDAFALMKRAGDRRLDRLHRQQERAGGLGRRLGLLLGQGRGHCTSRAASPSRGPRSASARTS